MFPGGVNPRQMRMAMKRLGIQQEELEAEEVIIRLKDKEIVISNPQVSKVNMMGQETYQITGEEEIRERSTEVEISEDDIETVTSATGVSNEAALKAIREHNGDLAAAIMKLKEE